MMKTLLTKLLKLVFVVFLANAALFCLFWFDLDGKLLFNVVEPFLKKHYDNMERKDVINTNYDLNKFPAYKYDT